MKRNQLLNLFKRLIPCISCLPLLAALPLPPIQIQGIEGDVLLNVQRRLTPLLVTHTPLTEITIKRQVTKAMAPYGFFTPHIRLMPHKKPIVLALDIIPGPLLRITTFHFQLTGEGAHDPLLIQTKQALPLRPTMPFTTPNYEKAKEMMTNAALTKGYLHGAFKLTTVRIDNARHTADIRWTFDTGPQYYFGQLQFDPTYLSPALLHRYVPFAKGEPYAPANVATLNTNLTASGYFSSVNVTPLITTKDIVPINVHLQPTQRVSYTIGAGYGTDTGPRGVAGLHIIPVNRVGHTFNAIAQGSFAENALLAQYIIPGGNPVINHFNISGGVTNLHYNSGNSNAVLLGVAQSHVLPTFQRILSINDLHERYHYTGFNKQSTSLIYPKALFSWNDASDPLFSPSGYNVTLTGLAASKAIVSRLNMAEFTLDAKAAFTLSTIRTRLYLHAIQGAIITPNIYQVPLSLAQLLGGAPNLKGYDFNSIGPGKYMRYGGLELQKETKTKWYLLGFLDAGSVSNPLSNTLQYDAGIGLMWISPIGPIKVAVAQPIQSVGQQSRRSPKLVVNMGPDL